MSKKAFDKIAAGLNEALVVARGSWQRAKSRAVIKDRDGTVPDFMIGRRNGRNFVRVKPRNEMKMNPVLALDLATRTGWCVGAPGDRQPKSGSIRFASAGASHEAMFYGAWEWTQTIIVEHRPTTIVWEAPMPTSFNRGSTNVNVTTVLYGLPAVIGAAAYRLGVFDCRKANTKDVRNHFSRAEQAGSRWRVGCGYPTMLALRSARYYYDA